MYCIIIVWYCFNRLVKPDNFQGYPLVLMYYYIFTEKVIFFIVYIISKHNISAFKQKTFC